MTIESELQQKSSGKGFHLTSDGKEKGIEMGEGSGKAGEQERSVILELFCRE